MLDRMRDEDDGFTLVETLAAMVVFAILAVTVGGVILNMFGLTKSNTSRVAAANLAAAQIETVRQLRAVDVPDGAVEVTPKPKVNGVEYTVTRTANYVAADSTTSLCSGPSASSGVRLAYKLVTVTVTWDGMGLVQPVRQDTLLSLGIGFAGVDAAMGTGAIAVTGGDGQPRSGVTVTLSPGAVTRVTGLDGCAVFTGLSPSTSYTASVNQPGWVDRSGTQAQVSPAFSVTASGVTRVSLPYDRVGSLALTLAGPEGLQPPASLGVTLSSGTFSTTDRPFPDCVGVTTAPAGCVSGTPRTAAKLFPAQYGAWAGTCTDARPAGPVQTVVAPSAAASATLPLAGVRVQVVSQVGNPVNGHTVYALHPTDGVCLSQSWPMTPAGASSQALALPAGTWTLALTPNGAMMNGSTTPWPVVTLTTGTPVPTVQVPVP